MPLTVNVFVVMICDMALEVLAAKLLSPPYTAVMECGEPETESVLVEKVATSGFAPFNVAVPSVLTPSLKVIVPDGCPADDVATVAVNVTEFP